MVVESYGILRGGGCASELIFLGGGGGWWWTPPPSLRTNTRKFRSLSYWLTLLEASDPTTI